MRRLRAICVLAAALSVFVSAARAAGDDALFMPADATLEIAPDGNFLFDGKPRFLICTFHYRNCGENELKPGPGYGPEYAWIYESPPTREYLQRLGFDGSGTDTSCSWISEFRDPRRQFQARRVVDWKVMDGCWKSGLPMIVDYTAAKWAHGAISYVKGKEPAERAFIDGGHMMSYSLVTPEGRDLWRRMWRAGAEELKAHGAKPYVYELFNEPRYDDRSPDARTAFAAHLSARWKGDAAAMDRAWGSSYGSFEAAAAFQRPTACAGLGVEWLKFREACFMSGIRLGIETIREVDPSARFCFQPLGSIVDVVPVFRAYDLCEITMTPTGGGSLWIDTLLRAVSDGKPIVDGETYLGRTRTSHRNRLILEWARGLNASYYFKWERRMEEVGKEDDLKRLSKRYPWLGLNPDFVPPQELVGIMNAKRDIFAMQDLFAPRERGVAKAARAAMLHSLPTERLGISANHKCRAFAETAALALARDAHVPVDAVCEEQLAQGRLDAYRFLLASGVDATYPETPARLEAWVRAGGTLVLGQEALGLDEYGAPRAGAAQFPGVVLADAASGEGAAFAFRGASFVAAPYRAATFADGLGWEPLASLPGGHVAVARRKLGKGLVYYVGVRFPVQGDEGRFLALLAADCAIHPTCFTLDPATGRPVDGIEVHAARLASGETGFVLVNQTLTPRAVRFVPGGDFAADVLVDVSRRVVCGRDEYGAALLLLEPSDPIVLRGAAAAETLAAALSAAPRAWNAVQADGLAHESFEAALDAARKRLAAAAAGATKPFSPNAGRMKSIDLRGAANVPLAKALLDPPWGTKDCAGVPFDFIRPDQNGERSAIMLRSAAHPELPDAARGIDVNLRAEALYFLHAAAGIDGGRPFRYVVRYADGTSAVVELEASGDVRDLEMSRTLPAPESFECYPGWVDAKEKGLWAFRWENPSPEKTIASIDVESACGAATPLVAAISAETVDADFGAKDLPPPARLRGWGGAKAALAETDAEIDFAGAKGWPGAELTWGESFAVPEKARRADVVFDLSADGQPPPLQVNLGGGRYYPVASLSRRLAAGAWRVAVPLDLSRGGLAEPFAAIGLQRRGEPPAGAATKFRIGGFHVVWRGEAENPLALRRLVPDARDGAFAALRDGGVELAVTDRTGSWCALNLHPLEPIPAEAMADDCELVFEVNAGRTPLGARGKGRMRFRVGEVYQMPDKSETRQWTDEREKAVAIEGGSVDGDCWTWQTVRAPLGRLAPEGATGLKRLVLQLCNLPPDGRSGLVFRNFRLAPRAN